MALTWEDHYKKLDSLAQRGEDSYMEFRDYIEELVNDGQYSLFEDVIYFKYKLSI
jgi:hypothetical protein